MSDTPLTPTEKILKVSVSPMFAAILDCALDNPNPRTNPRITSLAITSDGFLMGWNTSRPDKEGLLGNVADFDRNLRGLCAHADLTVAETTQVVKDVYAKIRDWRTSGD